MIHRLVTASAFLVVPIACSGTTLKEDSNDVPSGGDVGNGGSNINGGRASSGGDIGTAGDLGTGGDAEGGGAGLIREGGRSYQRGYAGNHPLMVVSG